MKMTLQQIPFRMPFQTGMSPFPLIAETIMAGIVITEEIRKTMVIPCVKAICSATAICAAPRRNISII
jgi:hypothetical protein